MARPRWTRPRSYALSLLLGAGAVGATLTGCGSEASLADEEADEGALTVSPVRPKARLLGRGDPARRVLVVVSAADTIDMLPDERHRGTKYVSGVFARELSEPLKVLAAEGYSFDFATPGGVMPTWDKNGLELSWFFWGDSEHVVGDRILRDAALSGRSRDEAVSLLMEAFGPLKISDKPALFPVELPIALRMWKSWAERENLRPIPPKTLTAVADLVEGAAHGQGPAPYVGLLVPGGHAPMTDLAFDADMARILRVFHADRIPTAVVCHGPVALLSTTGKRDVAGWRSMSDDERAAWPYAGYTMTVESTFEEKIMEKAFADGQKVAYYVDGELERAGAKLNPARPTVVPGLAKVSADRELVSGQSPASANCMGRVLAESMALRAAHPGEEWWRRRGPVRCDGQPD